MGQLISEIKISIKEETLLPNFIFINVALFVAITLLTVVFRFIQG